ncbi:hypothetical protein [Vibrio sp. 10N.239.312.D08]|uniref:hypothetical protein n=1 Tax=Vibrio sp. 10N.239.312.D08 TaxID=3229978 RepID=UPI00354DB3DE
MMLIRRAAPLLAVVISCFSAAESRLVPKVELSGMEGEVSGIMKFQCFNDEEVTLTTRKPLTGFTQAVVTSENHDEVAILDVSADKQNQRFTFICQPGYANDNARVHLVSDQETTTDLPLLFVGTSKFGVSHVTNNGNSVHVKGQYLDQPFTVYTDSGQILNVDNTGLGREEAAFLLGKDFKKGFVIITGEDGYESPQFYISYEYKASE